MSMHRTVEAYDLKDIGAAAKLMAIYLADQGSPEAEYIAVSSKKMQEFCCVQEASVFGLLRDLVWRRFLKDFAHTDDPDIIHAYFSWHNAYTSIGGSKSKVSKEARAYVEQRDRVCVYCGCEDGPYHIDHILPSSRGGSDDVSNLALACAPCNISKRNRTPEEWGGKADRTFSLERIDLIRAGDV